VLARGREFAFGLEPDLGQRSVAAKVDRAKHAYTTNRDERKAVAQRIFAALCAHYPKHYIALIEPKAAANPPEQVLSAATAAAQAPDHSIG